VSLLILPAVITLSHHTAARLSIAGVSLVVLLLAIAFSKRKTESMDGDVAPSQAVAAPVA
jgi:hypothetical protein